MIRSIFRIIEYVMGKDGVLLQNEYYLYIFDAVLMFLVVLLFNVWHPSAIISKRMGSKYLQGGEDQGSTYPLGETNTRVHSKQYDSSRGGSA